MDKKTISQAAGASGYPIVKSISIEGSCYKVKALTARGDPADLYFNPATGDVAAAWISVE
ncbi:PepSY domain-containing protein [Rhizobium leguminosarum]|uniref:PepSY domain-containing protein n=1 Tax=Rhizobium leguminosarum TaxID=384 RepID=A0ACD5FE53_RHILE